LCDTKPIQFRPPVETDRLEAKICLNIQCGRFGLLSKLPVNYCLIITGTRSRDRPLQVFVGLSKKDRVDLFKLPETG